MKSGEARGLLAPVTVWEVLPRGHPSSAATMESEPATPLPDFDEVSCAQSATTLLVDVFRRLEFAA